MSNEFGMAEITRIEKLLALAGKCAVGFDIHHYDDMWCCSISSASPTEGYVGQDTSSLIYALNQAIEWLFEISKRIDENVKREEEAEMMKLLGKS